MGAVKGIATFVRQKDGRGEGRVYRLNPPLIGQKYNDAGEYESVPYEYVWVSAVWAFFSGPETYIFGCDSEGNVLNWGELEGSFRGALDIEQALHNAGYEVQGEDKF